MEIKFLACAIRTRKLHRKKSTTVPFYTGPAGGPPGTIEKPHQVQYTAYLEGYIPYKYLPPE